MLLNFRQLEVFRAIMVAKTISGAAELLNVSQPGISRLLKYMEFKLGVALFERHKGRLIPTPEGLELFRELEPVYQRVEGLDNVIHRIVSADMRHVQIACAPSLSSFVAPWLFAKIKQQMPDLVIKLETLPNEDIAEFVTQQRSDFGIALSPLQHPLIESLPSIELGLEVVVPDNHPLAELTSVSVADIAEYPLINFYPETMLGKLLKQGFDEIEALPKTSVMVRYLDQACAMVEQGLGVTLSYQFSGIEQRFPGLTSIPFDGPHQQVYFVRHNGFSMSSSVRQCFELAQAKLQELGDFV